MTARREAALALLAAALFGASAPAIQRILFPLQYVSMPTRRCSNENDVRSPSRRRASPSRREGDALWSRPDLGLRDEAKFPVGRDLDEGDGAVAEIAHEDADGIAVG